MGAGSIVILSILQKNNPGCSLNILSESHHCLSSAAAIAVLRSWQGSGHLQLSLLHHLQTLSSWNFDSDIDGGLGHRTGNRTGNRSWTASGLEYPAATSLLQTRAPTIKPRQHYKTKATQRGERGREPHRSDAVCVEIWIFFFTWSKFWLLTFWTWSYKDCGI